MIAAVITGDLVGSSKLPKEQYEWATKHLSATLQEVSDIHPIKSEIYRGDSFQLVTTSPYLVIKIALMIKLGLLKSRPFSSSLQCTMSIAIGECMFSGPSVGRSQGEAFVLSGRGLDETSSGETSFHCNHSRIENIVGSTVPLCDVILSTVTEKQSRLLFEDIKHGYPSNGDLAKLLAMSAQSASNMKTRIGARQLYQFIDMTQRLIKEEYND